MTFIASVIAKDSIVILADSLTTFTTPVISIESILNTYPDKTEFTKEELFKLISPEPIFSQEDGEKMFVLDSQTIITTAGDGKINGKLIKDLIEEFRETYNPNEPVQNRIQRFKEFLTVESLYQLNTIGQSPDTCFILSCYNAEYGYEVYDIKLNKVERVIGPANYDLCNATNKTADNLICAGQTRITDKLLWGASLDLQSIVEFTINTIAYKADNIDPETANTLINKVMSLPKIQEYKQWQKETFHIRDLSTQEAVDFISLLYETAVKFHKYEKRFPCVGGNVKIGILNKQGFKYLSNNDIRIPEFLQ